MNNVILSDEYPQFSEKLTQLGYNVIYSETVAPLISYERRHADMQCLILDDTAFVLRECSQLAEKLSAYYHVIPTDSAIGGKYPENVRLNAAVIGKNVIAKLDSLDKNVKDYCQKNHYRLIHVNQGYTKCSCAVVSDHALITADNGIYNSLKEYKIDVLKIEQGRVALSGADYGFIGGASGLDICGENRTLYFAGNIDRHPDCDRIKKFCQDHVTEICSLSDTDLTDIGGILFC